MSVGVAAALLFFLFGLAVGVPIGWVFLISTYAGVLALGQSFSFAAPTFFHAIYSHSLMGIAFFIYAGGLISEAGLADRIVRFSHALVGHIKGGMILVCIVATLIMSALTGSSVPCVSALVPLLVPRLEKFGYKKEYTAAVISSSSFLGYLIPPSVPALIYCLVAQQSVAALFLATIVPGLILAAGYAVLNHLICARYIVPVADEFLPQENSINRFREIMNSTWSALPALGAPVLIMVGIYGGIFTPNEAGAIGAVYCLVIGFFVYRELDKLSFWKAIYSTCITQGMTFLLLGAGTIFTRFLIREGAAQALAESVLGLFDSKILILLSLNIFLLILGMFIDGIPILVLAVPMLLPLVSELNINLVHLGSMIILNVGLGVVTPPYAVSIFVGSRLAGVTYNSMVKPMMLYLIFVGIPVLLLTTYIPGLSCWLPSVILGDMVVGPW